MEFIIDHVENVDEEQYFIILDFDDDWARTDEDIAEQLLLDKRYYQNILIENGGFIVGEFEEAFFKTRENAKKAVEHLEPYLIALKLRGIR